MLIGRKGEGRGKEWSSECGGAQWKKYSRRGIGSQRGGVGDDKQTLVERIWRKDMKGIKGREEERRREKEKEGREGEGGAEGG